MNVKVVYYSGYKGNTRKVASIIAEMFSIKAERIGKDRITISEPVDLLFIGSGVYFGRPHKKARAFIKELNASAVKNAAAFGTYGHQSTIGEQIKLCLHEQGINTFGETFVCKGASIGTDNGGHPNAMDLENAEIFAGIIAAKV